VVDDVDELSPKPGQVIAKVLACGICGSDLHALAHADRMVEMSSLSTDPSDPMNPAIMDPSRDVVMGHEFSAEVLEAGPDTEAPARGTLVTSLPVLVSAAGMEPIVYSNRTIGGYAERMLLSAPLLTPIHNGLDPRRAALTEPMAVGLHAVNKSAIERGEAALVLGCGPIGIAIVAALRHRGVETIVASDYSARRRELALAMGATSTVDPADGSPFDSARPAVVFEAVGVPGIIDDILRRAPVGARVVVAGVCMQADAFHPYFAIAKQINVQFVLAYGPIEFTDCLRAIADGDIDVAPMITDEVGLDGVGDAFDALAHPDVHCKILVTP